MFSRIFTNSQLELKLRFTNTFLAMNQVMWMFQASKVQDAKEDYFDFLKYATHKKLPMDYNLQLNSTNLGLLRTLYKATYEDSHVLLGIACTLSFTTNLSARTRKLTIVKIQQLII